MNIRVVLVCVLSLLMVACKAALPLEKEALEFVFPVSIALEDDSGNVLGYGIPVRPEVFVAPDHLWQVSESLYFKDYPIEVLARDFRHDLLFFRLSNQVFTEFPQWSTQPPGVGQSLTWEVESGTNSAPVFSAKADFELGTIKVEELMQLSAVTKPGNSGKALYDAETKEVFGMLVASDSFKDVSYFVRSDVVLNLALEYLGAE